MLGGHKGQFRITIGCRSYDPESAWPITFELMASEPRGRLPECLNGDDDDDKCNHDH